MSRHNTSILNPTPMEEAARKLNLLSMVDIFRDLTQKEMEEINKIVKMVTIKKGQILYRPEEEVEVLFLLKKGKIQAYTITAEGKRLIVEMIGPGTFFGEMPLTAQSLHQTFAEATEDSLVCVLSRGDLERLLQRKPKVAVRLVEILSSRLEETRTRLEESTLRNATARVCQGLLRLAQGSSELPGLTHQELADSIGLSRETVNKVLNRLKAQGLLVLSTKKIIILDKAGLNEVAELLH